MTGRVPPGRYPGGVPKPGTPPPAAAVSQELLVAVNFASDVVRSLVNALHMLTQQANAGNPQSRQLLKALAENLELARAAARGIVTPNGS